MGFSSWWNADAPHWSGRTIALTTVATGVAAVVIAILTFRDGTDATARPEPAPSTAPSAVPAPAEEDPMCAASSDSKVPAGWGPDRPIYHDDTFPNALTFNSTSDNENIGDERNWVGAKPEDHMEAVKWSDSVEVVDGATYVIRAYVRLDGPSNYVAEDTRLSFLLPVCTGRRIGVAGILRAEDAYPGKIWDGTSFWSRRAFNLVLVPDSATLMNNKHPSGLPLSAESLVTSTGVKLGFDKADGIFRPGYAHSAYVTFRVRAQVAQS